MPCSPRNNSLRKEKKNHLTPDISANFLLRPSNYLECGEYSTLHYPMREFSLLFIVIHHALWPQKFHASTVNVTFKYSTFIMIPLITKTQKRNCQRVPSGRSAVPVSNVIGRLLKTPPQKLVETPPLSVSFIQLLIADTRFWYRLETLFRRMRFSS